MKYLIFISCIFFFKKPHSVDAALATIKKDAVEIDIGNINCSITCNGKSLYCDTIVVNDNGTFTGTCELPFKVMDSNNRSMILNVISNDSSYSNVTEGDGVKYIQGDYLCFSPTIAMLFRNKDSVVFAQALIDLSCQHFVLYYYIDKHYLRISNSDDGLIDFYNYMKDEILDIGRSYRLNCLNG